jgi:hypothetical protein
MNMSLHDQPTIVSRLTCIPIATAVSAENTKWICEERSAVVRYTRAKVSTYSTVHPAHTDLVTRGSEISNTPCQHYPWWLRDQSRYGDVNVIPTVERFEHSCGCAANSTVSGCVLLLNGGGSDQRGPARVRDVVAGGKPDVSAVNGGLGTPGVIVEPVVGE